jgi:hypothetical protein
MSGGGARAWGIRGLVVVGIILIEEGIAVSLVARGIISGGRLGVA